MNNILRLYREKNQVSRKGFYRKISQKQILSFVYSPKKNLYAKIQACKSTNVAYSLLQNSLRIVKKNRRITLVLPLYQTIIYAEKISFQYSITRALFFALKRKNLAKMMIFTISIAKMCKNVTPTLNTC